MNQMVQEWKATQERRKTRSEFWKAIVIPAIMIGAAVIISIVMIKLSADWNPPATNTPVNKPTEKPNVPIISDVIP